MEQNHTDKLSATGYSIGTRTHVGLWRQRNEDYLDVGQAPDGLLLVVCDGMGGHRGGERASRLAVENFIASVTARGDQVDARLREGVRTANEAITREATADAGYAGMGTTLVAALLRGDHATVVNVGDSRAYLFHQGELSRISNDHSLVAEMVARGEITEEAAASHPRRNIITRALGSNPTVEADIFEVMLGEGDAILLASDGLHGMVSDNAIRDALAANPDPAQACDVLVESALEAGGNDNISVILARYDGAALPSDPSTDPGEITHVKGGRRSGGGSFSGRLALILLMFIGLAAIWLFLIQPGMEPDVIARDTSLMSNPDSLVSTDTLGGGSPAFFDSTAVDSTAVLDSTPVSPDTLGIGGADSMLRPGDTLDW